MLYQTIFDEISATFSASTVRDDYGVPGSPTFTSIENVELYSLELFGRRWTEAQLESQFGRPGAAFILNHLVSLIDDNNWTHEPDEE